jgi:hypothetical protein
MRKDNQIDDHAEPGPQPPARMSGLNIAMPPEHIALFKAIVESYDNLATLRTEDPRAHRLKLYFAPEDRGEVAAMVEALAARFSIRILTED